METNEQETNGGYLKKRFLEAPESFCEPLTFGELEIGNKYIAFPYPGDNEGHGGFRRGSYLFEKIEKTPSKIENLPDNCRRLKDGNLSNLPDSFLVLKVIDN